MYMKFENEYEHDSDVRRDIEYVRGHECGVSAQGLFVMCDSLYLIYSYDLCLIFAICRYYEISEMSGTNVLRY